MRTACKVASISLCRPERDDGACRSRVVEVSTQPDGQPTDGSTYFVVCACAFREDRRAVSWRCTIARRDGGALTSGRDSQPAAAPPESNDLRFILAFSTLDSSRPSAGIARTDQR